MLAELSYTEWKQLIELIFKELRFLLLAIFGFSVIFLMIYRYRRSS